MNTCYFLGANSARGFVSLYEGFAAGDGDFLHVIKGGPGTGKSAFMRAIGESAERRGLDVEYVLCSGDPQSLDGVYIPARHEAWVDGTAPHVMDPRFFAASGDYVDIGRFCSLAVSTAEAEHIRKLNKEYKSRYAAAYELLAAAAAVGRAYSGGYIPPDKLERVKKRTDNLLKRCLVRKTDEKGCEKQRFLSAISCEGSIFLTEEIQKLCPIVYELDDRLRMADAILHHIRVEALQRGAEVICCLSPLEPERAEAVLLPQAGLAFVSGARGIEGAKHIRLDAMADAELLHQSRSLLHEGEKLKARLLRSAENALRDAKRLHDALESMYKPHVDFPALTEYTLSQCKKIEE